MPPFVHDYPYDPSYGYTLESLMEVELPPPPPADFAGFWEVAYRRARRIKSSPWEEGEPWETSNIRILPIRYSSVGGRRIGGWLTTPRKGPIHRLVVVGHGYGGQKAPVEAVFPGAACLHFCARGLPERSLLPDLPSTSSLHVTVGIAEKSTYLHGECCGDLWTAASALHVLSGRTDLPLYYWGSSFGGGIGALALPWDSRFSGAFLRVPSFGNHPFRLSVPCRGSGEAVRKYWRKNPSVEDTLIYFDAASAARFLTIPTFYACAVFDPNVPPPGQFSVWRAHAGPKEMEVLSAGHFPYTGADVELNRAMGRARDFLTRSVEGKATPSTNTIL